MDQPHPLETWRDQHKLSLAELGRRLGLSDVAAGRYCRGDRVPRPDEAARILDATGGAVTPNHIYHWHWLKDGQLPKTPLRLTLRDAPGGAPQGEGRGNGEDSSG